MKSRRRPGELRRTVEWYAKATIRAEKAGRYPDAARYHEALVDLVGKSNAAFWMMTAADAEKR